MTGTSRDEETQPARRARHLHARLGLTSAQVAQRASAGLTNLAAPATTRSVWNIVRANVFTLFNAIVAAGFTLLLILGQWQDALFGFAALGNAVIGAVQEYRAKRALDRLVVVDARSARVLRDGTPQEVAAESIVVDDILILGAGDQIPADATVIESESLEVDEAVLTGEAVPVLKIPGKHLLSGSAVIAGRGTARVTDVGAASFASRLSAEAKRFSLVNSEVRNGVNRVLGWIAWALLPVTVLVVNGQMQAAGGWEEAISTGSWRTAAPGVVASVIAMIPLGLVLLTSIAFAVGGVRLAQHQVLIQELAAVEVLARVDIICLDKTGTLTEGTIAVDAPHLLPASARSEGRGWGQCLGWFGADPAANATARSLAGVFPADDSLRVLTVIPFSSARKWSAVAFTDAPAPHRTWVLGAPEILLDASRPTPEVAGAAAEAGRLAAGGRRTLLLATIAMTLAADADLPADLVPVVLLTFRERVRPDASRTLAYFREEGVGVRVISGDDPRTVAAAAREVGIDVEHGYDARTLPDEVDRLSDVMERERVFGRVTPAQKKDMLQALQSRGHVVAMTGDGVNDVLALKTADIGIAMSNAAPASKAVSRLVLLDGGFDRLPGVLAEGRRVMANMETVSVLFLSKTAYALAISVLFAILAWNFPFLPRQLSATDGLTIGLPCFFLALMSNRRRYRPGFLNRSLFLAVPAGLIVTAGVTAVNVYAVIRPGFGSRAVQTASVITLALIASWTLVVVARPLTPARLGIVLGMFAGLGCFLTIPVVGDFFRLAALPAELPAVTFVVSLLGCLGVEVLGRVRRRADTR